MEIPKVEIENIKREIEISSLKIYFFQASGPWERNQHKFRKLEKAVAVSLRFRWPLSFEIEVFKLKEIILIRIRALRELLPGNLSLSRGLHISSDFFFVIRVLQQTRVYPYPLVAGSARPNPKMGAPDPENPLFLGFSVLRGGPRPWSQTMVSEGARPWGGGRSGDCEFYPEGPGIEKLHLARTHGKNHAATHEISEFSIEIFILGLKISFSVENFNPRPCFSANREGPRMKKPFSIENFNPY